MSGSQSPLPAHVDEALRWLVHDYIDDAILAVTFEVHKAVKTGLLEAELGDLSDENQYLQVNVEGLDVFGQAPIKKSQECVCPNCSRSLAASRFAPHLEKCMGMGRNSSRIASRRIQNTSRDAGGYAKAAAEGVSWSVISGGSDSEKRAVLSSICGVVSEHTRKMCTRSMKCPQHTTFQRRAVREQLLGASDGAGITEDDSVSSSTAAAPDEAQEADGADEGGAAGGPSTAHSGGVAASGSWDQDLLHSSTTSPADSTSTVLSSHSTNSSNRSASLPPSGDCHSSNGSVSNGSAATTSGNGGSNSQSITHSGTNTISSSSSTTEVTVTESLLQSNRYQSGSGGGGKSGVKTHSSNSNNSRNAAINIVSSNKSGHSDRKSSSSNNSKKKSKASSVHGRSSEK
ncbi:ataxin-7-like protein 3 [Hyalella azteca]|uniref:SAGA-associated factor 11 homolog n=1 Tax=Hyalella azteca TaxID=294128 RepID=A0A8B7NY40_HYAAZ|nr:ataxin-7-like protein 3 [Hyalella azteca]